MGTVKSYLFGFILSIALSALAFLIVMQHLLVGRVLVVVIVGLALIQLLVQLIFFLHLDAEENPRWNLSVFLSTVSVILILVVGSLWIMNNLNYHMLTDQEILKSEAIQR